MRGRTRERGGEAKGCVRGTCVRMPRPGVLLSWSPGSYKSPYLGHGAFRGSGTGCETPSCRSCCPVSENKATGIGQRTSFAYFSAKIEPSGVADRIGVSWRGQEPARRGHSAPRYALLVRETSIRPINYQASIHGKLNKAEADEKRDAAVDVIGSTGYTLGR